MRSFEIDFAGLEGLDIKPLKIVFIVAHIAPHYTRFRGLGRRNLFKLGVPAHIVRISKGIASPVTLDRLCSCWLQADC